MFKIIEFYSQTRKTATILKEILLIIHRFIPFIPDFISDIKSKRYLIWFHCHHSIIFKVFDILKRNPFYMLELYFLTVI